MNTEITQALSIAQNRGFYENLVMSMLRKMTKGRLNLVLPNGACMEIGDGTGNIIAHVGIKSNNFFKRCVLYGDIGFGEAYVEGEWETDNITQVIKWFLLNVENAPSISGSKAKSFVLNVLRFFNRFNYLQRANSVSGSKKNITEHYDLSNDFFALFLDPGMTYSSAWFRQEGMSLEAAQEAKYERLCRQLHLKPSDHVLEIGSGWGANAIYMAKNYGCRVTTVTISEEQYKLAKTRIEEQGLDGRINVVLSDYRLLKGSYDKIVSVEMLEAVGAKYLPVYFRQCAQLLKKDGLLALQVITCPDARYESLKNGVDWIQKHIFPGSLLPSVAAINKAVNETSDLTLLDLKDMGEHYATTLHHWFRAFNKNTQSVKALGFDDRFIRKWNYYLNYCEAAFAMRNIYVMQLVYARPNCVEIGG